MKILLDIDDTAIITKDRGKTWQEHPRLKELIEKHEIYLYSGNPDIDNYHEKWKTKGYIPKGFSSIPKADVLIDNNFDLHEADVEVKKCYSSIDTFFRFNKNKKSL